jgi:hypothetical protein
MKALRIPLAVDVMLVIASLCCLVAAYTTHSRYLRAHHAADKAYQLARVQAAGDLDKLYAIVQEQDLETPEIYYRRAQSVAWWGFWVFCGAAICGLAAQRWIAVALTLVIWILALLSTGTRV